MLYVTASVSTFTSKSKQRAKRSIDHVTDRLSDAFEKKEEAAKKACRKTG